MVNNLSLQHESFVYTKRKRLERNRILKSKRKAMLSLIISVGIITAASFFLTHNIYTQINSKDLQFAVEYNLTSGFSSENKLLRVQKMSLIYSDGETSVIEASGLSKNKPHKNITVKGIFKKDTYKSWQLEKIISQ